MDDKQTDKRLRRVYGISLAEYEFTLAEQGGGCAICGKKQKEGGPRLHVDHDHSSHKVKVISWKRESDWTAEATYKSEMFLGRAKKKSDAVKQVRFLLKRASVRGVLCWGCNAAIQKFRDSPEKMENAAKYLRKFKGEKEEL